MIEECKKNGGPPAGTNAIKSGKTIGILPPRLGAY